MIHPKTLSGFMELLPNQQIQFNHFIDIIRKTYERYGFLPIDTPVLESSEVLLAKAGGETEKQIYRFSKGDNDISMRFDLTVPLAKYVAKNLNELNFPFQRYQIGKVYRGERPQKGRFREFYQCDIDVIGRGALDIKYDALVPSVVASIFKEMNIGDFCIKVSNRKLLSGYLQSLGLEDIAQDVQRLVDKYKKIGKDVFVLSLKDLNIDVINIDKICAFLTLDGTKSEKIAKLKQLGITNQTFCDGVSELETVINTMAGFGVDDNCYDIDLTIVRGLDYYTSTVYETVLIGHEDLGSVCGGGRYDNLASYYTHETLPGVGMSIGLTRLYSQLVEAGIIDGGKGAVSKAIILPMGDTLSHCLELAKVLRENDLNCEVYLQDVKFKHKISYAGKSGIKYAILVGEDEVKSGEYAVKDLESGTQTSVSQSQLIQLLQK